MPWLNHSVPFGASFNALSSTFFACQAIAIQVVKTIPVIPRKSHFIRLNVILLPYCQISDSLRYRTPFKEVQLNSLSGYTAEYCPLFQCKVAGIVSISGVVVFECYLRIVPRPG